MLQIFRGGKLSRYAELNCNSLETFIVRRKSCITKAYYTGCFTEKVPWLLIDPRKPQNFSTVNDLQYTV